MNIHHRSVIAILASGAGSTFRAVADAVHDGLVDFDIGLVITDKEKAGVLGQVAEVNRLFGLDIKTEIINKQRYPGNPRERGQTQEEAEVMCKVLQEHKIDHVALMGFWRILADEVVEAYGWQPAYAQDDPENQGKYKARMTNTHPGILPATADTYGIHTQEKVLEMGVMETAHSLLLVTSGIDDGPVIAEHRLRVYPASKYSAALADTPEKLFARVQRIEKANLALDIDGFLKDQTVWLATNFA